jgi:Tol biopolymer transport system component
MTSGRWQRIDEIYHATLARPPAERAAYLDEACRGDLELRSEVESLLAQAGAASSFLETNAMQVVGRALAAEDAASWVGRMFGHYEMRSIVGVGGMGDVYLAHDIRLQRDVAIKCLPRHVASDTGARNRLAREARLLATLNHPNIAAIHGVEEAEGVIGLVLEFVEGRTLADYAPPMDLALRIGKQIADALEAAHEKGIIHRDLKPANIKITPDGVVKVLDFGLAKAIADDGAFAADDGRRGSTRAGMILGTAAYMSPEQARGKPLDRRTDIWSFGCVLYELIARRTAFGAETATDCLVKVLDADPDWTLLPKNTPDSVRRLLSRCLEKDAALRLRDIADARLEIVEALSHRVRAVSIEVPAWRRLRWVAGAAAVIVSGAALASALVTGRREDPRPVTVSRLTFRQGNVGKARFTADGQGIVYSASWDGEPFRLFSTQLGNSQSRAIDLPPADLLALSRQNELAISLARPAVDGWEPLGTLAVTGLAGGAPRELYTDIVGADWSPDGANMALVRRVGNASRLEFPVGTVVHEAPTILPPRVSPDGRRVCFFAGVSYGELWVADRGGTARLLANDLVRGGHCAWTADGREVWAESGGGEMHTTLEAFDTHGGRRSIASYTGMVQIEDIAADGKVLITAGTLRYSAHGRETRAATEQDLTVFDATRLYGLAPDGRHALLWDNSPAARGDRVFLRALNGMPAIPLGPGAPAALTADGVWGAAIGDGVSNERTRNKLTLFPTRAGTAKTFDLPIDIEPIFAAALGRTDWARRTYEFSTDGNRLLIPYGRAQAQQPRVYVYDLSRNLTKAITPEGITGSAVLSPDGRQVAVNHASGVVIYTVDTGAQHPPPGAPELANVAAWSADGRSLFVIEKQGIVARVFRRDIASGQRVFVREIQAQAPAGVTTFDVFVSRNGESFAYATAVRLVNVYVIDGLR